MSISNFCADICRQRVGNELNLSRFKSNYLIFINLTKLSNPLKNPHLRGFLLVLMEGLEPPASAM